MDDIMIPVEELKKISLAQRETARTLIIVGCSNISALVKELDVSEPGNFDQLSFFREELRNLENLAKVLEEEEEAALYRIKERLEIVRERIEIEKMLKEVNDA